MRLLYFFLRFLVLRPSSTKLCFFSAFQSASFSSLGSHIFFEFFALYFNFVEVFTLFQSHRYAPSGQRLPATTIFFLFPLQNAGHENPFDRSRIGC